MFWLAITLNIGKDQEHIRAEQGRQYGLQVTIYHVMMGFSMLNMLRAGQSAKCSYQPWTQQHLPRMGRKEEKERI